MDIMDLDDLAMINRTWLQSMTILLKSQIYKQLLILQFY